MDKELEKQFFQFVASDSPAKRRDTDFLRTSKLTKQESNIRKEARARNYFFNECDTGHLH